MSRSITIHMPDAESAQFNFTDKAFTNAIGYLATWAIHSPIRNRVSMMVSDSGSIHASYFHDDNCNYTIYGMRDGESYSFHS